MDDIMLEGYSLIGTRKGVIISGSSHGRDRSIVWCYNGFKVFHLPSPKFKHVKHGSVMLDDKLYLIAGFNQRRVERLDFAGDRWEEMAALPKDRYDFACSVHDDAIYLVGGIRGLNDRYTNNIERFRPQA